MTGGDQRVVLRPGGALVLTAIVGVLVGLTIATTASVPGLPEPGPVVRIGLPLTRVLLDLAAAITVGMCLLPLLLGVDRPKRAEHTVATAGRIAVVAGLVWALAAGTTLVMQTAEVYPDRAMSLDAVTDYVRAVGAGKALLLVAALALVSAGLSAWAVRIGDAVPTELRAAVALLALLPLPVTGHAGSLRWHDLTMISIELHVLGAAAWTGGLATIVMLIATNRGLLAVAIPRFSVLATVCIAVVATTGVVNGVAELATAPNHSLLDGLVGTNYGLLLALKLSCLVGLAASGAAIRWKLLPGIVAQRRTALVAYATLELAIMGLAFGFAVVLTRAPLA